MELLKYFLTTGFSRTQFETHSFKEILLYIFHKNGEHNSGHLQDVPFFFFNNIFLDKPSLKIDSLVF